MGKNKPSPQTEGKSETPRRKRRRLLKAFGLLMVLSLVLLPACGHIQVFLLPVAESIGPEGTFRIDVGEEKLIALTIDDGPSTHTGQILDLLAENNATATFFIHADHAAALGDAGQQVLQRVLAEGHELGNHTTADVVSVSLKPAEFEATFYAADAYLRSMDVEPRWFRTAGGTFNPEVMLPTVITAGYEPTFAMASFLPWDTFLHLPGVYGRQIGGAAFPGAILVLHEGIDDKAGRGERTLTTLRELFRVAENRGYRLRSLSEVVDYSRQVDAGQGL